MPEPSRAASEPPADAAIAVGAILTGGEPVSLPPQVGNSDSPMPELLSLKDRLQLFEKVRFFIARCKNKRRSRINSEITII